MERVGAVWQFAWQGKKAALPDSKGLLDIATLIRQPNTPISAVELMTRDTPAPTAGRTMAPARGIERIDRQALLQYRERLRELDHEIDEAEEYADLERLDHLRREREFLLAEVSASLDLSGQPRSERGDGERARKAVEMRISSAIKRIAAVDESLARHLNRSIRTGLACSYEPDPPVEWRVAW
jgi:hypothetical protein